MKPEVDYSDQQKIFDTETWSWPVHLIGAGGINNLVGPTLAKMGVNEIHIWDDDILETRNCPTEVAYSYEMVGQPKVAAMAEAILHLRPDVTVHQHQTRVTADTVINGIVIAGVDSMHSRQIIWECVKKNFWEIPFFVDGRSAGEEVAIFAFPPSDMESGEIYSEDWLFDDTEALQLTCGARNIGYIADYMAAEICRLITRFHRNLPIEFYRCRNFANEE